ncbi:MAG: hypothetical protein KF891_20275 [Rhizobacter sp.]|nr:hypothetical protein [Rhizobacter sp.]
MNIRSPHSESSRFVPTWIPVLVFFDLLFLPRMLFAFGIPLSLLFVIASMHKLRYRGHGPVLTLLLASSMFASVAVGTMTGNNGAPFDSFKRALQLVTILFYAFYCFDGIALRPVLVKVLRAFFIYVLCALLLFYLNPDLYESILTRLYPEAIDELQSNILNARFAFFFSDPNATAYYICFALVGYLSLERNRRWMSVCALSAAVIVLTSQSRGGYLALTMIYTHLLYTSGASRRTKFQVLLFITIACLLLAALYSEEISLAYTVFESRFDQEEDLGGGRAGKYAYFLQNVNLLPFGSGYYLLRDGIEFRPHSDLIRLNLAYGLFAVPVVLFFVFPRRRSQSLLFAVFLIPFLINTVADDYRLLGMYFLMYTLLGQLGAPARTAQRRTPNTPTPLQAAT